MLSVMLLAPHGPRFMNLDPVAKRIMHEKPLPWGRAAIVRGDARGVQSGADAGDVFTFEAEVPVRVATCPWFLDR
jgi:hypothetical protein